MAGPRRARRVVCGGGGCVVDMAREGEGEGAQTVPRPAPGLHALWPPCRPYSARHKHDAWERVLWAHAAALPPSLLVIAAFGPTPRPLSARPPARPPCGAVCGLPAPRTLRQRTPRTPSCPLSACHPSASALPSPQHVPYVLSVPAPALPGTATHALWLRAACCVPAPLVCAGAQGVVYEGQWQGAVVAVKFSVVERLDAAAYELLFSKMLSHPCVVQTFVAKVRPRTDGE